MKKFKGIYWRSFTVTVGMVALTLVLLGASFFSLTYSYIMTEKRSELKDRAEIIAQMALDAYAKAGSWVAQTVKAPPVRMPGQLSVRIFCGTSLPGCPCPARR